MLQYTQYKSDITTKKKITEVFGCCCFTPTALSMGTAKGRVPTGQLGRTGAPDFRPPVLPAIRPHLVVAPTWGGAHLVVQSSAVMRATIKGANLNTR